MVAERQVWELVTILITDMEIFKKYMCVCMLCLMAAGVHAQQRYDHISSVGLSAPIYRSEVAQKYPFDMEGTVYAYSDEFETGSVVYNGKEYFGVLLNLNSHRDELQLKVREGGVILSLKKTLVSRFAMGEREFVNISGENAVDGLKAGYYEVLHDGKYMLVKKHWKNVTETGDMITGEIKKKFSSRKRHYLLADGKVHAFKDCKGLASCFKEMKGEMKVYMKAHRGFPEDEIMQGIMEIAEKGEDRR